MSLEEYKELQYSQLQKLCKERGLGGKGSRDSLIDKLVNADMGHDVEPDPPTEVEKNPDRYKGLKATDPNPDNPNWDMAGRWIRR